MAGILEKTGTDTRARTDGHADTKDGQLWKRRALMEKTDSYGKDGQLWKRRTVMEKTDSYRKDGQLWKRRALMEKTDTYGKDGHLWKRRAIMEKTGIKFLKARFLVERLTPRTTSITHIVNKTQNIILTGI